MQKKAVEIADKTYILEDGKIALKGGKEILKNKRIKEIYLGGIRKCPPKPKIRRTLKNRRGLAYTLRKSSVSLPHPSGSVI